MKILQQSRELTKIESYLLTQAPTTISMKELEDNVSIPVDAWCEFEKQDENGDYSVLLAILSNKQAFVTQSATFRKDFMQIAELMGDDTYAIMKVSGKTKAGRDFIDCTLDVASIE